MSEELLHRIDKRLAVLEALSKDHSKNTDSEFQFINHELRELRKEVGNLKIKAATISCIITVLMSLVTKIWLP